MPLDRTYAVLDDMERRYRAGGHSLQAVYTYRHRVAAARGRRRGRRRTGTGCGMTTPRDELSDCAGCDPTRKVQHLAARGRDEEAVALAEPVLAGRLTCPEQPQAILTALLLPYLRTGRLDEARDAHRRAYRAAARQPGRPGRHRRPRRVLRADRQRGAGLELVERHLDWLDRPPSPAAAMHFAAAASAALRQAGPSTVYRRAAEGRPAAEVSAASLADELAETAAGLAARFDARNGTSQQSEWIARRLAVQASGEYVPLSASVRRRPARPTRPVADEPGTPATSTERAERVRER